MKKMAIWGVALSAIYSCTNEKIITEIKTPLTSPTLINSRKVASVEKSYDEHLKILASIPLLNGAEYKAYQEDKMARELVGIFNKIENENQNAGELNRGTHAKGSCFNGELNLISKEDLKNVYHYSEEDIFALKQGVFSFDGTFPLTLRFANAKSGKNDDTLPDVRALSFSFETDKSMVDYTGANRIDFMMNSSPMFAVRDIKEFYELMKTARLFQKDFHYWINPFYLASTIKAKNLLKEYERNDVVSYADETYWGNVPYVSGLNENGEGVSFVKYRTTPCQSPEILKSPSQGKEQDYLQKDIALKVKNNQVCFFLEAQIFNIDKAKKSAGFSKKYWDTSMWIEHGGVEWKSDVMPFLKLAKIITHNNSETENTGNDCESLALNTRLHSHPTNRPLGSLSRVRAIVEENSRARRFKEIP